MKSNKLSSRAKIMLGFVLALVCLVLTGLLSSAWTLRQENNQRRAEIEPRIARLLGVQANESQLKLANEAAAAQIMGFVYPATADSTMTGTKMQQDVRKLIEKSGMSVVGSRVRAVKVAEGYDEISLELTIEGSMEALEKALLTLPHLRPMVVIQETDIKPKQGRNAPHKVIVRLRLMAVRLQT